MKKREYIFPEIECMDIEMATSLLADSRRSVKVVVDDDDESEILGKEDDIEDYNLYEPYNPLSAW